MPTDLNVLASVYRGLIELLVERGYTQDELASSVSLELENLRTPQATLSLAQISALWDLGYRTIGPTIGIEFAQRVKLIDFQDIGVFLTATENIADWLHQIDNYSSLFSNVAQLSTKHKEDVLEAQISYYAAVPHKYERLEFLVLFGPMLASQYLDSPLKLHGVELTRPTPDDPTPWLEAFNAPITWGAEHTLFSIDHSQASRSILTRNNQTKRGFKTLLDSRLKNHRSSHPLDEIRAQIIRSLPDGAPSIRSVASALNLSSRSLQRRLSDADTTFSQLLSEIRAELAQEYLNQNIDPLKITTLLGYSELTVFKRAFKHWTGLSISEFCSKKVPE